jgi:hypothetical protein
MRIARYFPALLLAATACGQTCLSYNKTVTIQGTLRRWIGLRPDRLICTVADPE